MPARTSHTYPNIASPKSATSPHFYNIPGSKYKYASVVELASQNPLLYRVSHRNSGSFYFEGQGVVANEYYSVDPSSGERCMCVSIEELVRRSQGGVPKSSGELDAKLLEHVKYSKVVRTNLVSTTLSFTWALFFAEMNISNWNEEDVELLAISTHAVAPRAFISQERIGRICSEWYKGVDKRKISCESYTSQEIIVMNCIPESAIVSHVPWATLRLQLPSWFYYYKKDSKGPSARDLIPVPKDECSQRHKRWRSAVQAQLEEMLAIRPAIRPAYEIIAFVMSALSYLGTTPNDEMKAQIQCASRCMLSWSRKSEYGLEEAVSASIIRSLSRGYSTTAIISSTGKSGPNQSLLVERRTANKFLASCGTMGNFKLDRAQTKDY